MRITKLCACASALLLVLAIPTRSQTSSAQTAPAKPKASSGTAAKPTGTAASATYDHSLLKPALLKAKAPDTYQAKFETTRGDFTITVTRGWSPQGADRFYNLIKHHYYDNARIYRVVPNFVAQFGISERRVAARHHS
jgi:peptidyl-prolyl cis-trans isomerase A (cyclophilin A)